MQRNDERHRPAANLGSRAIPREESFTVDDRRSFANVAVRTQKVHRITPPNHATIDSLFALADTVTRKPWSTPSRAHRDKNDDRSGPMSYCSRVSHSNAAVRARVSGRALGDAGRRASAPTDEPCVDLTFVVCDAHGRDQVVAFMKSHSRSATVWIADFTLAVRVSALSSSATIVLVCDEQFESSRVAMIERVRRAAPTVRLVIMMLGVCITRTHLLLCGRLGVDDVWDSSLLVAYVSARVFATSSPFVLHDAFLERLRKEVPLLAALVRAIANDSSMPHQIASIAAQVGVTPNRLREAAEAHGMSARGF